NVTGVQTCALPSLCVNGHSGMVRLETPAGYRQEAGTHVVLTTAYSQCNVALAVFWQALYRHRSGRNPSPVDSHPVYNFSFLARRSAGRYINDSLYTMGQLRQRLNFRSMATKLKDDEQQALRLYHCRCRCFGTFSGLAYASLSAG